MKIGLWNIDHPEAASGNTRKQQRFDDIADYLIQANCDAYIITEANAAMNLPGFSCELSDESPFRSSSRHCGAPNSYHQVAIYGRNIRGKTEVAEPINGLRVDIENDDLSISLYGNVITIKEQWSKTRNLGYSDRLDQQVGAIRTLPRSRMLVAGDFNLRLGWPQRLFAHARIRTEIADEGWIWPTANRDDTVQHVLHSPDLEVDLELDFAVKYGDAETIGFSDHPFIKLSVSLAEAKPNTQQAGL